MTIPTALTPSGTVAINEDIDFTWESGGTQLGYRLKARVQAGSTWVVDTETVSDDSTSYTVEADTLSKADYEWLITVFRPSVYPADTLYPGSETWPGFLPTDAGETSTSEFFKGRTRPAAPTITAPESDETIDKSRYTVKWVPDDIGQDHYQVQRTTLTGDVRENSGEVAADETVTEYAMLFQSTNVSRIVRVRSAFDGLWSPWGIAEVSVLFVGPAIPVLTATPDDDDGRILLTIVNPDPTEEQPTLDHQDIYRRLVGETGDGIRRVFDLASGASAEDYFVASDAEYQYRVLAYGSDDNVTITDWQE